MQPVYYFPMGVLVVSILILMYVDYILKRDFMKIHMKETGCKGSFRVGHNLGFCGAMLGRQKYNTPHYCYRCKSWFNKKD